MYTCSDFFKVLESVAPPAYQEAYDNCGLLTSESNAKVSGVLCTLDVTEEIVEEAIRKNCNLIVAHHPVIFGGIKHLRPDNYVSRTLIKAIKHDIAIYAIHTNLDNVLSGVSGKMAEKLQLKNISVLSEKKGTLSKLQTFVPNSHLEAVAGALFEAGAGKIGNYDQCSFRVEGKGTFRPLEGSNPFVGEQGLRHYEEEVKIEVVFPAVLQGKMVAALKSAHPYEEVAYDILPMTNNHPEVGSGVVGELLEPMDAEEFLKYLSKAFLLKGLRYTKGKNKIKKVAVCGGAGSFLIQKALIAGADAFVTSDIKYHEFFGGEGRLMICDIGHFESEQYTIELLYDILVEKFPNFAILKSEVNTCPVNYFWV